MAIDGTVPFRHMRQVVGDVPLGGSPFPPIAEHAFLDDREVRALVAASQPLLEARRREVPAP
jgi:hypothetical protein